jgi:hypothetical protein
MVITAQHKTMLVRWSEWYKQYARNVQLEGDDFRSLAKGFFMALGATPEEAGELYAVCIAQDMF